MARDFAVARDSTRSGALTLGAGDKIHVSWALGMCVVGVKGFVVRWEESGPVITEADRFSMKEETCRAKKQFSIRDTTD